MYEQVLIILTDTQRRKLARAVKRNTEVTLRLSKKNFEVGDDVDASTILLTKTQINKLNNSKNAVDITLSRTQVNKLKSGGFLGALLGGLAASVLPGLLGIGKGVKEASHSVGEGVFLKMKERKGNGIFLKRGKNIYDISDVEVTDGSGIGTIVAKFLPKVLPVLKGLAKNVLGGLAIGAASEGASQAVKAIAGRRGSGLYLKRGGKIYDVTPIVEEMYGTKSASGLLSMLGINSGFLKKIPILGTISG